MSSEYFQNLNYTLANEDTALELAILPEDANCVVTVNGSGGRAFPLLARRPKRLVCVDLSTEQLKLSRLRLATVLGLSYVEFLKFWGFPPEDNVHPVDRKHLFEKLTLGSDVRSFFAKYFDQREWASILYDGRWERTFKKLATLNSSMTGEAGRAIFKCRSLEEQKKYLETEFPHLRWSTVLFFLSSATVFNALLYGGKFPKPNISDNMFRFYRESFQKLFSMGLARENFFLQLCFFGHIVFPEGVPVEADQQIFSQMKAGATTCQVDFVQGDLIDTIREMGTGIDFVSLSDVPSYFSGDKEKYFMQQIRPSVKKGGIVVLRSYRHRPDGMMLDGWEDLTPIWHDRIQREKVGVYLIEVFRKADG